MRSGHPSLPANRLTEEVLWGLNETITNFKDHHSYSLAVQIEIIFSLHLLQTLLIDVQEDLTEKAKQVVAFLSMRWDYLKDTAALDVRSQHSRINQACWTTVRCFQALCPDMLTLSAKQFANFQKECEEKEAQMLKDDFEDEGPGSEENIFPFIYRTTFKSNSIKDAFLLLPKAIKVGHEDLDAWHPLLSHLLVAIKNRQTFIGMLATQVARKDWKYFFSRIAQHSLLFKLILGLDLSNLLEVHSTLPIQQRTDAAFNKAVFAAADNALRARAVSYAFKVIPAWGAEGSAFKSLLIADHGCKSQMEVLALAYSLLAVYRRVRTHQGSYTTPAGKLFSTVVPVVDKDAKVASCDVLMAFCSEAEGFNEKELKSYLSAKRHNGLLNAENEAELNSAIQEGVLSQIVAALFAINAKVEAKMASPLLR